MGKFSLPFKKSASSDGDTHSFENPRYRENNVDLQPVGTLTSIHWRNVLFCSIRMLLYIVTQSVLLDHY